MLLVIFLYSKYFFSIKVYISDAKGKSIVTTKKIVIVIQRLV